MQLPFIKYQGTGNDFILVDNRNREFDHLDVARLCHPKFGIGADGLMLLQNKEGYDFEMVYYNSDGKPSSMCGNGGRCIVDFAKRLNVFKEHQCLFIAVDGEHLALWKDSYVELQMKDVSSVETRDKAYVLNTGSPHFVQLIEDVDHLDILPAAKTIRYSEEFKAEGINVNFIEILGTNRIRVRTYERGVENETLSCGTGVTASALSLAIHQKYNSGQHRVQIETPGGSLEVKFKLDNGFSAVWLCGPATRVYSGLIEV